MRLSCLQDNLAKGLSIVGRAVDQRGTMPVLNNILLATDDARLKLSATNLELAITAWVGAKVEEEGAITIPARLLTEFINSLPPDKIEATLDKATRTLKLQCPPYEANIKGIDADDFPPIPKVGDGATTAIEPEALRKAIVQVVFAAATDESRPIFAGVLMSFNEKTLTLAAADGFRLAVRKAELIKEVAGPVDIIVPARALQELGRILADEKEPVEIMITPNKSQALFSLTNIQLVSRLIEGKYPDYQRIIPQHYVTRVVVDTAAFLKAARIASLFARDAANILRLQVTPGGEMVPGKVTVAATAAEVGDTTGGIDAVVEGEELQIAFNAKYLTDVLGVTSSSQVGLEMTTSSSPGVIKPVGEDGYIHVIMPMHIGK